MKKTISLLFIGLALFGCSNNDSALNTEVEIRIANISGFDFKDIVLNTSGGERNYGNVDANQISVYNTFDFAYRYAFVELQIDGEIYTVQPFDYVGEPILTTGQYTYEIDANTSGGQYDRLILSFKED